MVEAVKSQLRSSSDLEKLFDNSASFSWEKDFDTFMNSTLWGDVEDRIFEAIKKYTPQSQNDVQRNSIRYERKKVWIIDHARLFSPSNC